MPNITRLLALAATVTVATLTLTACATGAENDSNQSSTLTIYAGRDEALIEPLIEQFTEETGIATDVRYGKTPDMSALLIEEGERTPAQVFISQDAGALGALSAENLLATLPKSLTEQVPAEFTSQDDTWVGVTGRARVITYDSQAVAEEAVPDSIFALTEPEWNGKVAFAPGNASFQSFVTALRVLEGEQVAEEWVAGMAANNPVLVESNGQALDLVNSGQVELALINHYYWFERENELGADAMRAQLKFLPGDPGGIVNVSGVAVLKNAAEDANALEFVQYLIAESAQAYFVANTFEYPLAPGVAAPVGLPSLDSLANPQLDLADLDSLSQTQQLLTKVGLL
jgi:iron(III) transport system substrate-binding protein